MNNEDYFEDCAVCQFEKDRTDGKLSQETLAFEGLKDAFKKAKEQGAVVGFGLPNDYED